MFVFSIRSERGDRDILVRKSGQEIASIIPPNVQKLAEINGRQIKARRRAARVGIANVVHRAIVDSDGLPRGLREESDRHSKVRLIRVEGNKWNTLLNSFGLLSGSERHIDGQYPGGLKQSVLECVAVEAAGELVENGVKRLRERLLGEDWRFVDARKGVDIPTRIRVRLGTRGFRLSAVTISSRGMRLRDSRGRGRDTSSSSRGGWLVVSLLLILILIFVLVFIFIFILILFLICFFSRPLSICYDD